MSEVKVNKISPRSGTAITLGDSGDTFTIPSGATLAIAGSVTGFTSAGIDDNATSVAITIDSSERVAIGTTSPTTGANLTLAGQGFLTTGADSGSIALGSNTSYQGRIYQDNAGSDLYIENTYANTNGDIIIKTNSSERIRVKGSGNVGIGTTSPVENLQVMDTGSNIPKIRIETSDGGNKRLDLSIESSVGTIASSQSTQQLAFKTAGGEAVRIDATGKVGIGTSAPDSPLDILTSGNSGLEVNAGTSSAHRIYLGNTGGTSVVGTLSNHDFGLITNGSERMRIDSSGNVGIGTTNPQNKLHLDIGTDNTGIRVNSTDATTGIALADNGGSIVTQTTNSGNFRILVGGDANTPGDNSSEAMRILSDGKVGIGTSSPSTTLDIRSASPVISTVDTGDSNAVAQIDGNAGWLQLKADNNNTLSGTNITFSVDGSEKMRIDSSGKVGINTTSPYGKFEVHSGGGGSNYSGSSAIKSGVTWDSEASSHTISLFNYNENDNSSGMLLVHAKGDNNKVGTLMLLFTKKGGSGVSVTTVATKTDGMSTFSASTSGNDINISTDSDCAICWQSYYGV